MQGLFALVLLIAVNSIELNADKGLREKSLKLTPAGRKSCTLPDGCVLNATSNLDFFLIGDIGGLPVFPYFSYAQNQVAKAMVKVAGEETLRYVLNMGDNFYFNGAAGVQDIFDSRFEDSFEEIYTDSELTVPWYTIAGNHDHVGNVTAQLLYTNFSSKWTFPRLFYKVRYSFGDDSARSGEKTAVEVLMIDTVVLCGNTVDIQGQSLLSWLFAERKEPDGPPPEYKDLAKEQLEWIEEQLRTSHADYLFVAGHYPIYSTCEHGPLKCLERDLDPLLRRYGVSAYFSGHDHNLQHIQLNKTDVSTGLTTTMTYIVSGAASRSDRSAKHLDAVPSESLLFRYPTGFNPFSQIGFSNGAFVHGELRPEFATFKFYSGANQLKYEMRLPPRHKTQK